MTPPPTTRTPGTGTLFQHKTGRLKGYWVGQYRVTDATGKRTAKSVGDWDHDRAEAKLDALVAGLGLPATVAELRKRDAEKWAEGALWAAVECGVMPSERVAWLSAGDNPYETKESTT